MPFLARLSARFLALIYVVSSLVMAQARAQERLPLASGWSIQTSAKVQEKGEVISTPQFRPAGWVGITVPNTIVSALVHNKTYPDPYYGKNLRELPGMTYPIGENFANVPMDPSSPFAVPWWYRTQFQLPAAWRGKSVALHFDGINYRATVWLNGTKIAGPDEIAGAWRIYEFNVTKALKPGTNTLAVEVTAPKENDLAITFVDWNPTPPDKNLGLFRQVYLTASGPVTLRHAFVRSKVAADGKSAQLTFNVDAHNTTDKAVRGTLRGTAGTIPFSTEIQLAPGETKDVELTAKEVPGFAVKNPQLWWPAQMGTPALHDLHASFVVHGAVSDSLQQRFGIREITSEMNEQQQRMFRVNGKPILIRGGGWATDMMLRIDPKRVEHEVRYAQDMGFNTIRLEGKLEPKEFFELTDRLGMLVMAGWCCCDHWEKWENWKPEDYKVSAQSQEDQLKRLRSHPSILVWLDGSDNPPPAEVEKAYLEVANKCKWPNPTLSSATAKPAQFSGPSGVKMTGPYDYVPPDYWSSDPGKYGGAWGFNTETSPGPAVPPAESIRAMLPKEHQWPPDDWWDFHAGGGQFKNINVYKDALKQRYGPADSLEQFTMKAQAMNYEGIRAMFEAYGESKYKSTGVIQWMMNNGWPSTIWHLYDWYLRPGGGYFGAKKATETLHAQYSPKDGSLWIINSGYTDVPRLKLTAQVLGLDGTHRTQKDFTSDAKADSATRISDAIPIDGEGAYFLSLHLADASGKIVSSNFYWLSTKPDTLDWEKSTWYYTPATTYADFTALDNMPKVKLQYSSTSVRKGDEVHTTVKLKNPSKNVAFLIRLKANKGDQEILPVLWQDNYFSLLPGEAREITATHDAADVGPGKISVTAEGWNTQAQ
jgi:exo-1,4-beta-D-glucosaminidase